MGGLILLTLFIEVGVLLYLELKAWNTIYTPFTFLMLPYVAVLIITILVSGHWGIVEFYYPSIVIWIVGLLLFAIPSHVLGFVMQRNGKSTIRPIRDEKMSNVVAAIAVLMCVAFLFRLIQTAGTSAAMLGSDEFGMDFNGHGIWAHLSKLNSPLLVLCIYYIDKHNKWLLAVILLLLFFGFIHQVKGWIVIPCLAGLSMRLYSGKTRLTGRFILFLILGALSVFIISYVLSLVVGGDAVMGGTFFEFIGRIFVHYLTSGTLGLSMDAASGFPDKGDISVLLAPVFNIVNLFSGSSEIVSPINDLYYFTGLNLTNVRSFFGTVAVFSEPLQFVTVILFISAVTYLLRLFALMHDNVYINVVYFYQCALLFMGWFDYYFGHLDVIEVPVMTFILWIAASLFRINSNPVPQCN